jgi:Ig-like domain from next to BRCA1 gene/Helix-turn-helix domain
MVADKSRGSADLERFLAGLRALREQAGEPSLRVMARRAHYSHTALSGVLSGDRLPSLALTLAFVRACAGDEDEWRRRWHKTRDSLENADGEAVGPAPHDSRARRRLIATGIAGIAAAFVALAGAMLAGGATPSNSKVRPLAAHPSIASPAVSCPKRPDPGDRPLVPCDDDRFVADVTIPDGASVRAGYTFVKTWEIQNTGLVPWQGRYLTRQGLLTGPGLCDSAPRVAIPSTKPGQDVRISVTFTAPSLPGSCRVDWKMTDGQGRLYFPDRAGLYVIVNVTG